MERGEGIREMKEERMEAEREREREGRRRQQTNKRMLVRLHRNITFIRFILKNDMKK